MEPCTCLELCMDTKSMISLECWLCFDRLQCSISICFSVDLHIACSIQQVMAFRHVLDIVLDLSFDILLKCNHPCWRGVSQHGWSPWSPWRFCVKTTLSYADMSQYTTKAILLCLCKEDHLGYTVRQLFSPIYSASVNACHCNDGLEHLSAWSCIHLICIPYSTCISIIAPMTRNSFTCYSFAGRLLSEHWAF